MPENPDKLTRLWKELKRNITFREVVMFAATAYIIMELVNNLVEPLHIPVLFFPSYFKLSLVIES